MAQFHNFEEIYLHHVFFLDWSLEAELSISKYSDVAKYFTKDAIWIIRWM